MQMFQVKPRDSYFLRFATLPLPAPFWLSVAAFTVLAYLLSLHALTPVVPGTRFSLMSLPLALLAFALIVRPWREAPVYAWIHAIAGLYFHAGILYPGYAAVRIAIEIVEALVVMGLLKMLLTRLGDPRFVALYASATLAITAAGGALLVAVTLSLPSIGIATPPDLIDHSLLAWRHWWLGHSCAYFVLAGPLAVIVALRRSLLRTISQAGPERRTFIWLTSSLLIATLIAFPVIDLSGLGLAPDMREALRLLPLPFAVALASRFRAKGTAVAIVILALVVILSLTGPAAGPNWAGLPPSAAQTQAILLMTATACMVIGAMSRQVSMATESAIRANDTKRRFVTMLNHELRTPLNAILGFSELVQLQKARDGDQSKGPIENIHASGQRLLAMIEGLLDQADHGASAFELHKQPLRLRSFVEEVIGELQPELAMFRYPIAVDIPEEIMIEADDRALQQILLVLLSYPLRFVSPWMEIKVTASQSGTDTVLEVGSQGLTGAGIDERDKLELQLAKALALAHGARLTIVKTPKDQRTARLTFFATRAAG